MAQTSEYHRTKPSKKGVVWLPPETEAVLHEYKEPLRPVEGGFGYLGTLSYDKDLEWTQCHICGFFYKHLGKHIRALHDLTSDEYKEKFGIEKSTSLFATNTRSRYVAAFAAKSSLERLEIIERLQRSAKERYASTGNMAGSVDRSRPRRLEWYNKRGNCPDQIIDKILRLKERLQRTPTSQEFTNEYGRGFTKAAAHHFGTWTEAVKTAGLNPVGRHGRAWYTEEACLEMLRNFKRMHGREPFSSDLRTNQLCSAWVFIRIFGSWAKAKEQAFRKHPSGT
jgi:hypothetical protein